MKNTLLCLFLLCFTYSMVKAQSKNEIKSVAKSTCACLKNKNFENKTKDEIQMELGVCMIASANEKKLKFDFNDYESGRQFGEKVGAEMVSICPDLFLKIMTKEGTDGKSMLDDSTEKSKKSETVNESYLEISGRVTRVENKEMMYVYVEDDTKNEKKFLILSNFANAENFINNHTKYIGTKITVYYKEVEYFSPKANEFAKQKEITGLAFEK